MPLLHVCKLMSMKQLKEMYDGPSKHPKWVLFMLTASFW